MPGNIGGKMKAPAQAAATLPPEWLITEMPPGYQNRVAEIRRLSEDLGAMDRFGRLLWQVGPQLHEAVRETFVALKLEAESRPGPADSEVAVKLDSRRRLLLYVSAAVGTIQKKSEDLAHVFQMLHESAEDTDRVVLVANSDPVTRPTDRTEEMSPEAVNFLKRMGANFLAAPTLFKLWTLSLQDQDRARKHIERLHAQDGGMFLLA
jgi:hypothetical protein